VIRTGPTEVEFRTAEENVERRKMMNDTITDRVQEAVGSLAGESKVQMEEIARQAAGAARDAYGQVRDRARDVAGVVSDSVVRQPIIALLVAGVVGCMLGLLLSRRG
jgi:ElaB/YqjD/DUF883 family membrane-anchored ribosome-binding protein